MFCPKCHRLFRAEDQLFCPHDGARLSDEPRITALPSRPTEDAGTVIADRYRIVGLLGEGSMARVFLAEDTKTGQPVALKKVRAPGGRSDERKRLFHEVLVVSQIAHESLVRVMDVGELPDKAGYVVMEVLHGETLGSYLRRERTMPPDLALPFMRDVVSGLSAAHRAGVVHRDIKPDNLFLIGHIGDPYRIKIVDFGLAKGKLQMTAAGVAVGTVGYMAPEQALADRVDGRADVYAVGVVLYRMLVGRLPFHSSNTTEMLAHHVIVPPAPFPSGSYPDRDLRLAAVILTALRKRPEHRYATIDALGLDLDRLMGRRSDPFEAPRSIEREDVYLPENPFGQMALRKLYSVLKLPHP